MPKEHTGKARHQGTTDNSNIEHCTQSLESSNAKVQKILHGKLTLHVPYVVTTEQLQYYIH